MIESGEVEGGCGGEGAREGGEVSGAGPVDVEEEGWVRVRGGIEVG